jgi:hypothetical protein
LALPKYAATKEVKASIIKNIEDKKDLKRAKAAG